MSMDAPAAIALRHTHREQSRSVAFHSSGLTECSRPLTVEADKEDPKLRHALGRIPERGDRVLRVVHNETVMPWSVITAFFDRKAGRVL